MTGSLIFKMELFKFMRDKKYLIAIAILAVLNTVTTLFYSILLTTSEHLAADSLLVRFSTVMIFITMFLFFANGIFLFLFPFHVLSIDYKNNVMAMMIASGVNRSKLFLSKIGAVLLLTLGVLIVIGIGPVLIVVIQGIIGGQINAFFSELVNLFEYVDFDPDIFVIIFTVITSTLNTVVMITAATILMKGRNTAIIVSIGFNMANSFITNMFSVFAFTADMSVENLPLITAFTSVLSIAIFSFIGLRALQRQNL